jgi:hypothetical protein
MVWYVTVRENGLTWWYTDRYDIRGPSGVALAKFDGVRSRQKVVINFNQ